MAIPTTAVVIDERMDPSDVLDYAADCTKLLDTDETISSYTAIPGPESTLLGLSITSSSQTAGIITMWLNVSNVTDPAFTTGVSLPIELTINTSKNRRYQRTIVVTVIQR